MTDMKIFLIVCAALVIFAAIRLFPLTDTPTASLVHSADGFSPISFPERIQSRSSPFNAVAGELSSYGPRIYTFRYSI